MPVTIAELSRATGLAFAGDGDVAVSRPNEPARAQADELALAMDPKLESELGQGAARAAVLWADADWQGLGLDAALFAPRARLGLAAVTRTFAHAHAVDPGVHSGAIVAPDARIGEDVRIGPLAVVGPGARIGAGSILYGQCTVGAGAEIGPGALIFPGARIGARVVIGARAIIHANAVVGADGFSFVTPERGSVESAKASGEVAAGATNTGFVRIHSLGTVRLGDDVEIGAGAAIDRGTIADTTVGDGTKIDNLVQIGHNCRIGSTCLICGHVGIAGSVEVGDRVVLGGKTGIGDHLKIGHDSVLAGGTLVGANIPPRSVMMGAPATPRDKMAEQIMAIRRLPRLARQVAEMRRHLGL